MKKYRGALFGGKNAHQSFFYFAIPSKTNGKMSSEKYVKRAVLI